MRKALTTFLVLLCSLAGIRRHLPRPLLIRGSGRDVTVQAESSSEARRTVVEKFPGAVVTGIHRAK